MIPKPLSCQHYTRACLSVCTSCKNSFGCKLCHDETSDHAMDMRTVREIVCVRCATVQSVSNRCRKCLQPFSAYFCAKCVIWTEGKVFHCDECQLCRVGDPSKIFHCKICNACMDLGLKDAHTHIENNLKSDCPICAEYLFLSVRDVLLLNCGHAMHKDCFRFYLKQSYQCPICQKTACDTTAYNKKVEYIVAHEAKLQKNWLCEVSCYDCRKTRVQEYTYLFNKCKACDSYNTRLGEIKKPKTSE